MIRYLVNLEDCCLVHATPDSRSGAVPAAKDAFFEELCFEYAIDIQAVVGHEFVQDPETLECIELTTGNSINTDIWGWHTTSIERGVDYGLRQAFQSPVTMAGPDWLYGPWTPIAPICSAPNMAFELLTSQAGGLADDDDSGVPDVCECPPSNQPQAAEVSSCSGVPVPLRTMRMIGVNPLSADAGQRQSGREG